MKTGKFDTLHFSAHLILLERGLVVDILSVRVSVCQTRGLWQTETIICQHINTVR